MSGGHFDYVQHRFNDVKESIEELIKNNDNKELNEWGAPFGRNYPADVINTFQKTASLLEIIGILVNAIDYLVCDDYGVETFKERCTKELTDLCNKEALTETTTKEQNK